LTIKVPLGGTVITEASAPKDAAQTTTTNQRMGFMKHSRMPRSGARRVQRRTGADAAS
jgi:hypothetical protein